MENQKNRNWISRNRLSILLFVGLSLFFYVYHLQQGVDTNFFGASVGSSTEEVAKKWINGQDNETVFQAAFSWYKFGILNDPNWVWVTNLWPPGMIFINYAIISVIGFNGKFIAVLIAVNSCLWSSVFLFVLKSEKSRFHRMVFFVGSSYLLSSWMFQQWVMGTWFAWASGFAIPFFLLSLFSADSHRLRFFSASMLAASALTRVTSNLVVRSMVVVAVLMLVVAYLNPAANARFPRLIKTRNSLAIRKRGIKILILLLLPVVAVEGWTSYVTERAHPEIRTYTVSVQGLLHGYRWRTSEDLNSIGGGFVVAGTGNWACVIAPEKCAEIAAREVKTTEPYSGTENGYYSGEQLRSMAINAFLTHPVAYFKYRAPSFWNYWSNGNLMLGIVMILVVCLAVVFALFELFKTYKIQPLLYLIFIAANTAPLVYIHLQSNYVFPIQLVSAFYLMFNSENVRHYVLSKIKPSTK